MPVAIGIGGAIFGSSLIGAYSANKAAKEQAGATKAGLAQSNALMQGAITQAKDYFSLGQKSAQAGFGGALDLFKAGQAAKYAPMIQGNVAAQKAIGLGATQANNAILGLPVDMSFANQPQALTPDLSAYQNAKLPIVNNADVAALPYGQRGVDVVPQIDPNASPQAVKVGLGSALNAAVQKVSGGGLRASMMRAK